jgi:phosphoglycerate dehydrogenase-like enzyme
MSRNVLVTSWRLQGKRLAMVERELARRDCTLLAMPPERTFDEGQFRHLLTQADALAFGYGPNLDGALMDAAPRLKVIATISIGYDHIDLQAASERGIVVANSVGCNQHNVAELAFSMMLALVKKLLPHDRMVRSGEWGDDDDDGVSTELWDKTLGVIGLGRIGKAVALLGKAFGMRVLATDIAWDITFADAHGISYVPLETLLQQADLVTVHTPLTAQTRGLLNAERIGWMKPSAYLINTARGPIVEEGALVAALREGRIAGAGLDVFAVEPYPDNPYAEFENVVLTPHIGGSAVESLERMFQLALINAANVLDGLPAHNQVNPGITPRVVAG